VLIEESVLGWKEYEMEVVRDTADNCIIICSIENVDPMGVHTGDSITVAPALTLTDKEYQIMRNASIAVLREIGVETGGSNVQFAVNPADGRLVVIEMNPRVSRSSALASKATGFPIAKVAAKLAVGYTLDELENDITGGATPASFEPSIDYVVTKIPRFAFEKFPGAEPLLTTAMKSVGEVMAIGRTFAESLQKALRGLETGLTGLDEIEIPGLGEGDDENAIKAAIGTPTPDRLRMVAQALRLGMSAEEVHAICKIDPWFLAQIEEILAMEARIREHGLPKDAENLQAAQVDGLFRCAARARSPASAAMRSPRPAATWACTRSTSASTPAPPNSPRPPPTCTRPTRPRLGQPRLRGARLRPQEGGHPRRRPEPHRPGHRVRLLLLPCRLRAQGRGLRGDHGQLQPGNRVDRLRHLRPALFRAADREDVLEILTNSNRSNGTLLGVIVQFGGQTPLKLADALEKAGIPILGTSPDMIDLAEDRDRFQKLLHKLDLAAQQRHRLFGRTGPPGGHRLGFPLVVRPSYVLGGRAMQIIRDEAGLPTTCSAPCRNWCPRTSRRATPTTRPARSTRCSAPTRCCSTAT
jgi:carbamoyl-phosphate synthase large subunit